MLELWLCSLAHAHTGGGDAGEDKNECHPECSKYCAAMPMAVHTAATPKMLFVGLWPALAYEQLGMYV